MGGHNITGNLHLFKTFFKEVVGTVPPIVEHDYQGWALQQKAAVCDMGQNRFHGH